MSVGFSPVDIQGLPISSATGALSTTTTEIAMPTTKKTTLVMAWSDIAFYLAINDGTNIDCGASNSAICPPNVPCFFPVRRGSNLGPVSVHVEAVTGSGTYYVSFMA